MPRWSPYCAKIAWSLFSRTVILNMCGTYREIWRKKVGNPFVRVELNTTDIHKAKKFYSQLFDWKLEDVEMGPSGTDKMFKPGAGTGGGMLKHRNPDGPSSRLAYVEVEDVAERPKKAKSLGAKISRPLSMAIISACGCDDRRLLPPS